MWITRAGEDEGGQASVELLALLPALGLTIALAWQALVAGETWWLAGVAAREAARAHALGGEPRAAAVAAVPRAFRTSAAVSVGGGDDGDDATVTVRLGIPSLVGGVRLGEATGRARMEPQR